MTLAPDSARSGHRPKGAGADRRRQILDQALRLFSEFGVHRVSTRQIAAAVGISQPSLYAHFPTKQAIVDQVCEDAFARLTARMQAVLPPGHGAEVMADLARVYIDFGLSEPDAYRVAFMIESPHEATDHEPDPALKAGLKSYAICRGAVAHAYGAGLTESAVDVLAQSIWASLHGLVSLLIARPTFPWADTTSLIDTHIKRLLATTPGADSLGGRRPAEPRRRTPTTPERARP